jgi:hypothetical protein
MTSLTFISFICSFLWTSSLVLIYLDDFRLSNNYIIKYIQIFSIILIPICIVYSIFDTIHIANYITDKDSVNLHGHVSLDKDAGKYIGQGLNTIGSSIGLGASIAGVSTAVAKGIAKSAMPPLQKAGIIVISGLFTGISHSAITNINRNRNMSEDVFYKSNYTNSSNINKLIDDSSSSPLENLLFDIQLLNYLCLSLVFILIIQISFKFYSKENIKLN